MVRRSYAVGIFFLAVLVVSVICLAHASPPDPTWIPGIYDRGDFDDAVLALLSIDGVTISPSAALGSDAHGKFYLRLQVRSILRTRSISRRVVVPRSPSQRAIPDNT